MLTHTQPIETLSKLAQKKAEKDLKKKVAEPFIEEAKEHGWEINKMYKDGSLQMKKLKPYGITIADRVWSVLHNMHFLYMNGEECPQLSPARNTPFQRTVDIDIVSVDHEVGLAVFVKASPQPREADESFHQDLDLYATAQPEFAHAINSIYKPAERRPNIKAAMIVFACNISISETDKRFARTRKVALFDENDLAYYEELVKHLGAAAKYQFLADVFDNTDIPALTIEVPAIRLQVGKIVYYSFAIHPEYLLKISYVAHRIRGNKPDEQAYQRMVERQRLTKMKEYIDRPAIFPTNIVINLKKKPTFEPLKYQVGDSTSGEFGKLILKGTYKSAWIIDGQHRLYSYSGHPRATTSLLSVIAFAELLYDEQEEFFVDINSKQKRVEQSLLSELFGQVHEDAPDFADRVKALITQAISRLDEEQDSPFYQRILKAEGKRNQKRCITIHSIFSNISDGVLTHHQHGILCVKDNDDATRERIVYVIKRWFASVKKEVLSWWDAGSAPGNGGLAMNDSVSACFIILRNVMQHLLSTQSSLGSLSNQSLADTLEPYAHIISKFLASFTENERQGFRDYGRGIQGQTQSARTLLLAIQKEIPDFAPPSLKDYTSGQGNDEAKARLSDIKELLLDFTLTTLQSAFGEEQQAWWDEGIPDTTKQRALQKCNGDEEKLRDKEQYLDTQDYMDIIQAHWDLFKDPLGHSNAPHYSVSLLPWLRAINAVQDLVNQDKIVKPKQVDELSRYHDWLRNYLSHQ